MPSGENAFAGNEAAVSDRPVESRGPAGRQHAGRFTGSDLLTNEKNFPE